MSTIRKSWPSADLWGRVRKEELTDMTPCPCCGTPAIVHQRDALIGALFCPRADSDQEKARLWAMAKRAGAYSGSVIKLAANYPGVAAFVQGAEEELAVAAAAVADFAELQPWIVPILAQRPDLTVQEAAIAARDKKRAYLEQLAQQKTKVNVSAFRRDEAGRMSAVTLDRYTYPEPEPEKPPRKRGVLTTTERKYALED